MNDPKVYDGLQSMVFFAGFYEGLLPFAAKYFGWTPVLSLPSWMPSPAWWIVATAALVAAGVLLVLLDVAKNRRFPDA
ncbi:hypothetical protein [Actinomadura rupiterrae]|uniref:hypothetical protein n=1 Tax=Actinomadura rupiterrae TaxID=559627 RepID=UPI0020A52090|nr:hypothetical protein [Actinomadura rupiterrae]MCP2340319.1 hypothetical protein [Actinomadura rupiterrae]